MCKVDIKHTVDVNVDVTLNGLSINDVLQMIHEWCHDAVEDTSILRQKCETNNRLDNRDAWKEQCDYIDAILYRILLLLGD